jgi:hypothetical protein
VFKFTFNKEGTYSCIYFGIPDSQLISNKARVNAILLKDHSWQKKYPFLAAVRIGDANERHVREEITVPTKESSSALRKLAKLA